MTDGPKTVKETFQSILLDTPDAPTRMTTPKLPDSVGVPEIEQFELTDIPAGNCPEPNEHLGECPSKPDASA